MKIGLLTFHRAINYGAVLQCYGLSESLRAMGHDVEIIDYRPVYIERYRQLFQTFNLRQLGGFKRIMEFFKVLIGINVRRDANCRFDAFLSNNFHFSHIVHYPQEIPQSYDVIIIGSDQVWCPKICFGFDKIYWGQFPHDRIKLLTYAASIGEVDQLSDLDWEQIKKRINVFDGISVRESQLKEALYIKLGLDVRCNIDPSLLLSKNYYESIVEMPNIEGDYILAFSVVSTAKFSVFLRKVSEILGCRVIEVSAHGTILPVKRKGSFEHVSPTVGGFLGLIKHAKCVVTTSFHGTVFSYIFQRTFYSVKHYKSSRVESFLSTVDMKDRLVEMTDEAIEHFSYSEVDYNNLDINLDEQISCSHRYLNSYLVKK